MIRKLPAPDDGAGRVETGPVQFGDDWPGVFIRGDNAGWYGHLLGQVLDGRSDAMSIQTLRGLVNDLNGCIIGPAAD